jgi:hypothetical protein
MIDAPLSFRRARPDDVTDIVRMLADDPIGVQLATDKTRADAERFYEGLGFVPPTKPETPPRDLVHHAHCPGGEPRSWIFEPERPPRISAILPHMHQGRFQAFHHPQGDSPWLPTTASIG